MLRIFSRKLFANSSANPLLGVEVGSGLDLFCPDSLVMS